MQTVSKKPRLEVVIVSYQSCELLRACLVSLQEFRPERGETVVHVIDNDSRDGTIEMVTRDFPGIRLEVLERNAGFAFANNIALYRTTAPYVLLLNPDTELHEGTLDHLLAVLDREPDVGMIGCRLLQSDGTFDHAAKRSFPDPMAALGHFSGIGRGPRARGRIAEYRAPSVDETGVGDVDAINGAFMLVRREAMEQVGLLDSGYWLYMEDLDWCHRFHDHGWRVVYDGRVSALHVKGGTSGPRRAPRQNIAFHRGMGRFYRKFMAGHRPAVDALVYSGIVGKAAASLLRNAIAACRTSVSEARGTSQGLGREGSRGY